MLGKSAGQQSISLAPVKRVSRGLTLEHGQRKKNRQVKSFEVILAAAHHHLSIKMSCPKRGPAEKGQDPPPPPGPPRTGTTRPAAARSAWREGRRPCFSNRQETESPKEKKWFWHLSTLPGPDRRRQKTSRRLPAIGPVLENSPRDGRTGDPSCTGCAELAGVLGWWWCVGTTTCFFHPRES